MLSNSTLDAFYKHRRQEVQKSILDVYSKIGTPIDIGKLAFVAVFNATTSMLWGGTLEGEVGTRLISEFQEAVSELSVIMAKPNVSDVFPVLARFDVQGIERKTRKINGCIERILDFVFDQRMKMNAAKGGEARKNEETDFLQFLFDLEGQKDSETSITLQQMKSLLMDIITAGTETTATTIDWVMTEIMRHPKITQNAYEELESVVGPNNTVEEFHIPKLQYLDAVVKETLRLHPALPLLLPQVPTQSSNVGGYTIPKSGNSFRYIPFGSGRRE